MQVYFSMLLLALAAVSVGLLVASLPLMNEKDGREFQALWLSSVTLFALTLAIGAWLVLRTEPVTSPVFRFGTLAHTAGFAALLLQAALFNALNESDPPSRFRWPLLVASVLLFALVFEWVRLNASYGHRTILSASSTMLALACQVRALQRLRADDSNGQISFLYWLAMIGLVIASMRTLLALTAASAFTYITQMPTMLALASITQIVFSVLSFAAIVRYRAEQISYRRGQAQMESAQVRALMAEKDRLILQLIAANKTAATGALSATLVHELAQPMTSLQLNLTMLAKQNEDAMQQQSRGALLRQCEQSMIRMREALQTFRGMFVDGGGDEESFSAGAVIGAVHALIEKEARSSAVDVRVSMSDGALQLWGRPAELQHAVLNLALNALQALRTCQRTDKRLELSVASDGQQIMISVADNGDGVDEAMSSRLFNLLESGRADGMGLGLWLCRHIADRHRGSISHRRNEPQGAIFNMILPCRLT